MWYYDPRHPLGFGGAQALRGYPPAEPTDDFLKQQEAYVVLKEPRRPRRFIPVYVRRPRELCHMDLANFDRQGRYNRGYNFLLCVIDAFTRKAWVVPLKNKKASTVLDGFKTIHAQAGRIDKLASDLGKEFFNREFAAYCRERNI